MILITSNSFCHSHKNLTVWRQITNSYSTIRYDTKELGLEEFNFNSKAERSA